LLSILIVASRFGIHKNGKMGLRDLWGSLLFAY